ncbi:hypothetical protein [Alienimonas californiensis]|uniref:hypothetical protein n=1 Tax=Alienimonas californiensis TaxID=2527989 RepID=UPI0011AAFF0C|nr:hypothetical protein [Alienimonas californiensis]
MSVAECANSLGFSYAPSGWHYFTAMLRDFDRHAGPEGALPPFEQFYEQYHHSTLAGLMGCDGRPGWPHDSEYLVPWSDRGLSFATDDVHQCGPRSPEAIRADVWGMWELYRKIQAEGYRPARHRDGYIRGVFALRGSGDRRFLVTGGQHRCAILSHLGVEKFRAWLDPSQPIHFVRGSELDSWPQVLSGRWSRDAAAEYFNLLFEFDGRERAPDRLGIGPVLHGRSEGSPL